MKVVTVIGARPQFIKAAAVSKVIMRREGIREVVVHTGQHFDKNMSDIFFDELAVPVPDYNLGIGGSNHGEMTGRQLEAIERVLIAEKPDWLLVYGDTNSTLAGALAAAKLHIPIMHVEAGLRSFRRQMPEEINRIVTDHVATKLMAPSEVAVQNLRTEGISPDRVHLSGDVMYDASLFFRKLAKCPSWFKGLNLTEGRYVLATVHRAENTDEPERLSEIFAGLGTAGCQIVMPLHPRTKGCIERFDIVPSKNIHLVDPVGYLEMTWLEQYCLAIATDSGGVQKEAYFFGKPCVTLRDETEWVELVDTGWNVLVGANKQKIKSAFDGLTVPGGNSNLYGHGNAAELIVNEFR